MRSLMRLFADICLWHNVKNKTHCLASGRKSEEKPEAKSHIKEIPLGSGGRPWICHIDFCHLMNLVFVRGIYCWQFTIPFDIVSQNRFRPCCILSLSGTIILLVISLSVAMEMYLMLPIEHNNDVLTWSRVRKADLFVFVELLYCAFLFS